ncbi:MAG: AmmeMemoRadiSam system protein A [Pseudomonadota bacterium]|nr:AmmeMemoRadiSam system protein A [Pseudomonadota bacterium]
MDERALGRTLLVLARGAIEMRFGRPEPRVADDPTLEAPGATFVTLNHAGQLRGCIGTLVAHRSLRSDVMHNAVSAAFEDPRFSPLAEHELTHVQVEVSKLRAPTPISFEDEASLLAQLRPHVDGVVLTYRGRRGTFLPQVWEALPDPSEFMRELKRKAGLPTDQWHAGIEVSRYTVEKWTESDDRARDTSTSSTRDTDVVSGQQRHMHE